MTPRSKDALYGRFGGKPESICSRPRDGSAVSSLHRMNDPQPEGHMASYIARRKFLESVRKHQAGLQSFRSMRRIEASRRNASALRLRFSQSFASLRQRLSQAKVRSTIQRRGSTTNPFVRSERLTISVSSCGKILAKAF